MTVEDDPLKISQQIALRARLRTPVGDPSSQLVQLRPRLADLLRGADHVVRRLDPAAALDEVRHVGHDGAHVLGKHNDIVVTVFPLGHLGKMGKQGEKSKQIGKWKIGHLLNQLVLLLCEAFNGAASQGGGVEQSPHLARQC